MNCTVFVLLLKGLITGLPLFDEVFSGLGIGGFEVTEELGFGVPVFAGAHIGDGMSGKDVVGESRQFVKDALEGAF